MEIEKYGRDIQELYQQQRTYLQLSDPRVLDVLKKMKKKAIVLKDHELIGYVYHSLAFAEYFIGGDYAAYLKSLRLSAKYLLSCDNPAELVHVYYLVAIDALNKGLYDLSHHFFLKARTIAEETEQPTSAAILEENIGHILGVLGAYKEARRSFQRSLRGVRKDPSHPHYFNNIASCYMNEAYMCLEMGLLAEAEKLHDRTRTFMEENPNAFQIDAIIHFVLLDAQIAIRKHDEARIEKSVHQTIMQLKKAKQGANYVVDTQKLVLALIDTGRIRAAGSLVRILERMDLADDATAAQRTLIETKIAYFKVSGKKKALLECYLEQDRIYQRVLAEQVESNKIAQDLIRLTNQLHADQEAAKRKQEELQKNVKTDALTGIANRYAGNIYTGQAFDEAFLGNTNFGICVLDVDGLKNVNDTRGHQAGDEMLRDMANVLGCIAKGEQVFAYRYGGDEFVLVFSDKKNAEIHHLLEKLRKETAVSFSAGVCNTKPKAKMKPWDFLRAADRELYAVKAAKQRKEETPDIRICSGVISLETSDFS